MGVRWIDPHDLSINDSNHNTDGRNYDINVAMPVSSPDIFIVVLRDESPLKAGPAEPYRNPQMLTLWLASQIPHVCAKLLSKPDQAMASDEKHNSKGRVDRR